MKKYVSIFLCLACVLTLVACGKKADPITLPQTDEITSIDITVEENTVSHSDKTWISEIIANISSSEPTKKESVQDVHKRKVILRLTFSLRRERVPLHIEDSGNTMLNSPIREFIRLIVNCTVGYKKPIKFQFGLFL